MLNDFANYYTIAKQQGNVAAMAVLKPMLMLMLFDGQGE